MVCWQTAAHIGSWGGIMCPYSNIYPSRSAFGVVRCHFELNFPNRLLYAFIWIDIWSSSPSPRSTLLCILEHMSAYDFMPIRKRSRKKTAVRSVHTRIHHTNIYTKNESGFIDWIVMCVWSRPATYFFFRSFVHSAPSLVLLAGGSL